MKKSIFQKEQSEVFVNELLAYTLAKIQSFEQARIEMYFEDNIYDSPPSFSWRYSGDQKDIYIKLQKAVKDFAGKVEWIMYRGSRNYVIEPVIFYYIRKKEGSSKLTDIIKREYGNLCIDAINDILPLCKHIEKEFNIEGKKPLIPKRPS